MRSIKESMVSRVPGQRAATSYFSVSGKSAGKVAHTGKTVRSLASRYAAEAPKKIGTLKAVAKAAGKVGGAVARTAARVAAPPLIAYDVYDTAKTVHETVGAARELGRVRAAGRAAEEGAADIRKAMTNKYPLAGTEYEVISKKLPKLKKGTTIGGILKVN